MIESVKAGGFWFVAVENFSGTRIYACLVSNRTPTDESSAPPLIDLFADTAAILNSIVSKVIVGCSGSKSICIFPLCIP